MKNAEFKNFMKALEEDRKNVEYDAFLFLDLTDRQTCLVIDLYKRLDACGVKTLKNGKDYYAYGPDKAIIFPVAMYNRIRKIG